MRTKLANLIHDVSQVKKVVKLLEPQSVNVEFKKKPGMIVKRQALNRKLQTVQEED